MKIFKEYIIAITLFSMLCTLTACWGDSNGNAKPKKVHCIHFTYFLKSI